MNEGEQAKKSSGLGLRVLSGIILAPVAITLIILGGWFFIAMVALALAVSFCEWANLVNHMPGRQYLVLILGGVYLSVCSISYIFLRLGFEQGAWLALCVILAVWASDTGAYFTGRKIGGPKLAPRVSPNKTWAGFGGAMFFCGLSLMILLGAGRFLEPWLKTDVGLEAGHTWLVFIAGCVLGAVGQAGDLLVSFFKRRAHIKDSGHLIPGHGGILDRIDSLLLVSPVFAVFVVLWVG